MSDSLSLGLVLNGTEFWLEKRKSVLEMTSGDSYTKCDSIQCHRTVCSEVATMVTSLLIVKFCVASALLQVSGGAGAVSACAGGEVSGASLGGCSLTQVLCEQMSAHSGQVTEDRPMEQFHFSLA